MTAARNWQEVEVDSGNVWDKASPLEGKFVKAEQDVGPNKSKMYTIETEDGEVKVWGSAVLDDKLMGVPQGTYVKLEYEGKKKGKNAEYNSYKVFIDLDSKAEPTQLSDDDVPPEFR
jgi:hypothetical protein